MLVRFPNTFRVIFDQRGLGDTFPEFMNKPWIDPDSGKEYPPLALDDGSSIIHGARNILHSVKATQAMNEEMANAMMIACEQRSLSMPVSSRSIIGSDFVEFDDDGNEVSRRPLRMDERAIFIEADALQIEMGNLVRKANPSGSVSYEPAKTNQHKDRYSSLSMAVHYIKSLEDENKARLNREKTHRCIGIVERID